MQDMQLGITPSLQIHGLKKLNNWLIKEYEQIKHTNEMTHQTRSHATITPDFLLFISCTVNNQFTIFNQQLHNIVPQTLTLHVQHHTDNFYVSTVYPSG